jgi:hypothetical protein
VILIFWSSGDVMMPSRSVPAKPDPGYRQALKRFSKYRAAAAEK